MNVTVFEHERLDGKVHSLDFLKPLEACARRLGKEFFRHSQPAVPANGSEEVAGPIAGCHPYAAMQGEHLFVEVSFCRHVIFRI